MITRVYIDGFNLYFGAAKRWQCKWLNPVEMVKAHLTPQHHISCTKYFTAKLSPRPHDPDQPVRQSTYLRALVTLPDFEIHLGHFLTKNVWMPRADSITSPPEMVRVIKTEEKGSDVNLASQLLNDAHQKRMECAVLVTGDSDLLMPVRIVKEELGLTVGVLNPQKHPCAVLKRHATFYKHLKSGRTLSSQFPAQMMDSQGAFHKPTEWVTP